MLQKCSKMSYFGTKMAANYSKMRSRRTLGHLGGPLWRPSATLRGLGRAQGGTRGPKGFEKGTSGRPKAPKGELFSSFWEHFGSEVDPQSG